MASAGGYDYEFVTAPPDRLMCKICYNPCRDAQLTGCCGAHFCRSCLQQVRRGRSVSRACPMCRAERFQTLLDKEAIREIKALHVYCLNGSNGCTWSGEVNDINRHVDNDCQFVDMPCPSNCGMTLKRQCIQSHLAKDCPQHCQYCGYTGHKMEIAIRHKKHCSQYPLPCPNGCELGVIPSAGMADHKRVCPLEIITCEYHGIGCNVRLPRRDLEKHDTTEMAHHLELMNKAFVSMAQDLTKAKSVQEIQYEEIKDMLTVSDDKSHLLTTEITTVKDIQSEQNRNVEEFKQSTTIFTLVIGILVIGLIVYAKYTTTMHNDQLWRMSLQQSSCLDMCTDGIVPVIIKMSNFTEIKENNKQWYSSPFLAFKNGYQMRLRVDIFHSEVKVTLQLLPGPYDDELEKKHYFPLEVLASVELLNPAINNHHRLVPFMFHSLFCNRCARRSELGNIYSEPQPHSLSLMNSVREDKFLHNDQLHFRVSIILINQDYFPMIVCYYYLYIVRSADLIWVATTVFFALAILYGLARLLYRLVLSLFRDW